MNRELAVQGDVLALHDGSVDAVPDRPHDVAGQLIRAEFHANIEILDMNLHDAAELRRRRGAVKDRSGTVAANGLCRVDS